jgi:hypothetical protein
MGCGLVGRTAGAVVFTWEAATQGRVGAAGREDVAPVRRRVEALCAAGADVAIISRASAAQVEGLLRVRPQSSGHLLPSSSDNPGLLELRPDGHRWLRSSAGHCTGKPAVLREIVDALAARGIGPGLILVVAHQIAAAGSAECGGELILVPEAARAIAVCVGDEAAGAPAGVLRLGGGRPASLRLLDEQLRRRERGRVPAVDEDPAWIIKETGADPLRHRVTESLFTLGSGGIATRGSVEEPVPGQTPAVLAAGVYDGTGPGQHLLPGPGWTGLDVFAPPVEDVRVLDMRTGVVVRTEQGGGACPLRSLRFASITAPGVVAMRAEAMGNRLRHPGALLQPPPGKAVIAGQRDGRVWATADGGCGGGIGALAVQRTDRDAEVRTVERMAAYVARRRAPCARPGCGCVEHGRGPGVRPAPR